MRKFLAGVAILALGASITACDRGEPAANADIAADANADVMVDANGMDANVMVDENAAMNAGEATENVTEQGSTDH